MRRRIAAVLALGLLSGLLAGCGGAAGAEVTVFAAASLTEALREIAARYDGAEVVLSFDSSGALKTQIQAGAECDLFLSAAPRQMDQLDAAQGPEKNPEGLDLVRSETRVDLLENKVVLAVPEGNPAGIASYGDLAARLAAGEVLLAVGGGDVPVGQYTRKIFDYYGLDEAQLAPCLTYGGNVKEVTSQVREGAVDCGIVYATDARAAGLETVDEASEAMCGRVVYPAAVLKGAAHEDEARDFLAYLAGPEAAAVFEAAGFTPLQ